MKLLTLDDVAGVLGCSEKTVRRRIRAGLLPTFTDGRMVRVREDDLRRYVAERVSRRPGGDTRSAGTLGPNGIVLRAGERLTDVGPCRRPERVS